MVEVPLCINVNGFRSSLKLEYSTLVEQHHLSAFDEIPNKTKTDKIGQELAVQVQIRQLLDYTKSSKMSVYKTAFINLLWNPGVAWTWSYEQMRCYLAYDMLLLHAALLLSSISVNLFRPEPGKRWRPGFHPQVMDDMSLRRRGWRMLRVSRNVSPRPLKPSSDWWIVAEPRPLNQTRDPSLHKTLGKTRCVFISQRLWHTPHFLKEAPLYRRRLYWSITAAQI